VSSQSSGKKVLVNSVIYSFSGLLLKCFSFFLLPLYTSYLTTEDYGITSVAASFLTTLGFVVTASLFSAVMRFYVDLKDDERRLKRFYGTVTVFTFISGIFWSLLLCLLKDVLRKYIFSGIDFFPLILVCILSISFHCQHHIYDNILKSQQKATKSSLINIAYFLLSVTLNIVFVVGLGMGALGVLLSTLISNIAYTLFFLIDMICGRAITFCIDLPLLKGALKYSIPIIPHNLSTQITVLVSQVFIGGSVGLSSVGLYSIAAQFGNIADTVQTYVNQAYTPWLYEKLHDSEEGYKTTIRQIVRLLTLVIGLFLLGITLFAEDYISLFLDSSYSGAQKYVPLVVAVFAIKITYYFYVSVLLYFKRASKFLFIATLSSSLINILLSAIFIPLWGVYGSIAGDLIGMILRVAIIIFVSKHFENVGLRVRDFVLNLFIIFAFMFAGLFFSIFKYHGAFSLFNFGYKVLITLLYVGLVFFLYRNQIFGFLNRFKERKKGK